MSIDLRWMRAALARRDLAGGLDIDRHVDRDRSGMKEVQGPKIDGGTGEVGAAGRLGVNLVRSSWAVESLMLCGHPKIRPRKVLRVLL